MWFSLKMIVVLVSVCAFVTGTMPENSYVEEDSSKCLEGTVDANCRACFDESEEPYTKIITTHYCEKCDTPDFHVRVCTPSSKPVYRTIESICIYFFTFDYLAKFFTVGFAPSSMWSPGSNYKSFPLRTFYYLSQPLNIVDLLATAPYWIELGFGSSVQLGFVRVLRLARVLRILKFGENSAGVKVISNTVSRSIPALVILSFYIVIGVVLFGSIIYMAELGTYVYDANICPDSTSYRCYARENNYLLGKLEPSPFYSIPMSFYWVLVTFTTVGYGDMFAQSFEGKIITCVTMICGILCLAMPISIIGSNFTQEYELLINPKTSENYTETRHPSYIHVSRPSPTPSLCAPLTAIPIVHHSADTLPELLRRFRDDEGPQDLAGGVGRLLCREPDMLGFGIEFHVELTDGKIRCYRGANNRTTVAMLLNDEYVKKPICVTIGEYETVEDEAVVKQF
jgi:hypothetical protein